jgi:hypothetical protein
MKPCCGSGVRSPEQGDAKAQTALGRLYAQGRGGPRDYAAAISWYRKASDQGDAEAQEALSHLHADGHGAATEPRESDIKSKAVAATAKRRASPGSGMETASRAGAGATGPSANARCWPPTTSAVTIVTIW